jgi:hypothetical protein
MSRNITDSLIDELKIKMINGVREGWKWMMNVDRDVDGILHCNLGT